MPVLCIGGTWLEMCKIPTKPLAMNDLQIKAEQIAGCQDTIHSFQRKQSTDVLPCGPPRPRPWEKTKQKQG